MFLAVSVVLGLLTDVMEALLPYQEYIVPLFWFGVVGSAMVAIFFYRHRFVRDSFVAVFLVGLLFFSTIAPVAVLPFVDWHKFSEVRPDEITRMQMRLVDENGREIRYPVEAVSVQMGTLNRRIVRGDFSETRNEAIARRLIIEAEEYRERSTSTSLVDYLRFPAHGYHTDVDWSEEVEQYGEFVGIRIYRITIITSPDGTERVEVQDELMVELVPEVSNSEEANVPPRQGRTAPTGST